MRVVTFLAFIFLESGMFIRVFGNGCVTGIALSYRIHLQKAGRIRCVGIVTLQAFP